MCAEPKSDQANERADIFGLETRGGTSVRSSRRGRVRCTESSGMYLHFGWLITTGPLYSFVSECRKRELVMAAPAAYTTLSLAVLYAIGI